MLYKDSRQDKAFANNRIRVCGREKASFIKLRRLGVSISVIARSFGRSTSVVYRVLRLEQSRGFLTRADLRKIPNRIRRLALASMEKTMLRLLPLWEQWICGESEKPP